MAMFSVWDTVISLQTPTPTDKQTTDIQKLFGKEAYFGFSLNWTLDSTTDPYIKITYWFNCKHMVFQIISVVNQLFMTKRFLYTWITSF